MKQKIDVYQIILDIGLHIPGILLINPAKIDEKTYYYHKENNQIYGLQNDIRLDFGVGSRGNFRFAGITDNYLAIYDLVTKMISTAVDQTSEGLSLGSGKKINPKPQLIDSVNKTNLYVPIGFPLPGNLSKMFRDPSTVHYIDMTLPTVGRLSEILKAGNYNLNHIDIYDKEKVDKKKKKD